MKSFVLRKRKIS